jgi:hypothetical protein
MKKIIFSIMALVILIITFIAIVFLIKRKSLTFSDSKKLNYINENKTTYHGNVAFNYQGELTDFIIEDTAEKKAGISNGAKLDEIKNAETEYNNDSNDPAGYVNLTEPATGEYNIILNGKKGKLVSLKTTLFKSDGGGYEFENEIILSGQPIQIDCQISENDVKVDSPLPQPQNFTSVKAVKDNQNHIMLTWSMDNTNNVDGFNIFSENNNGETGFRDFILEGKIDAHATSYTLNDLWDKSNKLYTISSFNNDGRESFVAPRVEGKTSTVANFSAFPREGKSPLTVQFKDESFNDVTSWNWEFGDRGTSKEQNPKHVYKNPGKYEVKLYIEGGAGKDYSDSPDYINVKN